MLVFAAMAIIGLIILVAALMCGRYVIGLAGAMLIIAAFLASDAMAYVESPLYRPFP